MTELVWAHGWMVPTAVILVVVMAAACLLTEDPRDAHARSEVEDDLRLEKAQRERERQDFERKILGE